MQIAPSDDVTSLFYGIPLTALRHMCILPAFNHVYLVNHFLNLVVVDMVAEVRGENAVINHLILTLLNCGKLEEARKLSQVTDY